MVRWALDKFLLVLKGRINPSLFPSTSLRSWDRNICILPNLIDIKFLAHNYANFWRRWNLLAIPFRTVFAPFTCIERPGGCTHSSHWLCAAYRASRIDWLRRHCWFDLLGYHIWCPISIAWYFIAALVAAGCCRAVDHRRELAIRTVLHFKGPSIRPRFHDTKKFLTTYATTSRKL